MSVTVQPVRLSVQHLEDRTTPATFTVTNLRDSGVGSLRGAIDAANAAPDADTIVFAGAAIGGTINLTTFVNLPASTTAVPQPAGPSAFLITSPITIAGTGETIFRSVLTPFRLFQVTATGSLSLRNLTLSNGLAQGFGGANGGGGSAGLGGAVYNQGTVTFSGCTLYGSQAIGGANNIGFHSEGGGLGGRPELGGGSPNGGISGGSVGGDGGFGGGGGSGAASGGKGGFGGGGGRGGTLFEPKGGGIGGFGGGGATRSASGFGGGASSTSEGGSGSGFGGAIFNQGGTVTLTNSTVAGNNAQGGNGDANNTSSQHGAGFGGGIFNLNGTLNLTGTTIAGNFVTSGTGGVANASDGNELYTASIDVGSVTPTQTSRVTIANSILAQADGSGFSAVFNLAPLPFPLFSTINASGPNIVFGPLVNVGTLTGTPFTAADPRLGPLRLNGGLTATMSPGSGSPAIDAGSNAAAAGLTNDQRGFGFPRSSNGVVDIGAVEIKALAHAIPIGSIGVGGQFNGTGLSLTPSGGKFQGGTTQTFFSDAAICVRTATADVNGDGTPDSIGGSGPGFPNQVVVLDGKTGATLASFAPFEASFTDGIFVAAADIDGDGLAEIVVTPDQGGGPIAAVYSGAKLAIGAGGNAQIARFFGIEDPDFRGGARPALGDVNGDGMADLVVSAGFLGGPRIAIFDGASIGAAVPTHLVGDFFAFENTLRNGAFVAVGDMNGDGHAEITFGAGPGGAPRVRVFDGAKLLAAGSVNDLDTIAGTAQLANFFAGDTSLRGGARPAMPDVDGDGSADLVTGSGAGEPGRVQVFRSTNLLAHVNPVPDQVLAPFADTVLPIGVYVG